MKTLEKRKDSYVSPLKFVVEVEEVIRSRYLGESDVIPDMGNTNVLSEETHWFRFLDRFLVLHKAI